MEFESGRQSGVEGGDMNWQLASESRLLDPAALARLRELGGDDLLGEVLRLFRPVAHERIRALHEAVAGADPERLRRAAHTLHGTASNIGALRLMSKAHELEEVAFSGESRDWSALIAEIETETHEVIRLLAS